MNPFRSPIALALLVSLSVPVAMLSGKVSDWTDTQGTTIHGEPIEILGPFALFKTSGYGGRRMLLRGMTDDDCRRFYRETASRPARAATWSEAKGEATRDLVGRVLRLSARELVIADLTQMPEPEILVVLYGSHNDGESWGLVNTYQPMFQRVQRVFPGRVGTVFIGLRHNPTEHKRIAAEAGMPWLIADLRKEEVMGLLPKFAYAEGATILAISRDGVPLLSTRANNLADIRKFEDDLAGLLALVDPANGKTWTDRTHYLRTVRPLQFAQGRAAPVLVGSPFIAEGLRQRGIGRIDAKVEVGADGKVTDAVLQPGSVVPEKLVAPLAKGFRAAVFVPAVENGAEVAGTYDFVMEVPPADKQAAADLAWLSGEGKLEISLPSWLVLKPVRVPERDFLSSAERTETDGTVVMTSVEVSDEKVSRTAQMNAFNSDWFSAAGAASVLASEGGKQVIDGRELEWKRLNSKEGLVDFREGGEGNFDYSIGYAWTEFDAPADMDAWLGIGSDDGLRIWLNGELVNDKWIRRQSRLDDDVVPLRLKQGKNQLLIKIQNASGDWSFMCRLRARPR